MKNHIIVRLIKNGSVLASLSSTADQMEKLRRYITSIHENESGGLTVWIDINI